jgi:type IV pilus assembly protein PilA
MQKNQKGFTIIELIVVIAIIAVLATIVMINVTSYIAKSRDSAIKGNLAGAMTGFAMYAETNTTGITACADANVSTPYNAAAALSGAESCADGVTGGGFCACAQLLSDTTKYFCVDSAGHKTETTVACSTDCVDGTDIVCDGL